MCFKFCREGAKTKLCPVSLGVGIGVAEALYLFLFALGGYFTGLGVELITEIGHTFHGYAATPIGGLIGAFWGFVDGFIFGAIVALVYDLCTCIRCKKVDADKDEMK